MMEQKVKLAAAETTRKLEGWPSATGLPLEPSSHLEEHLGLLALQGVQYRSVGCEVRWRIGPGIGNHDVHVIVRRLDTVASVKVRTAPQK
jgi:hypothetical protein